ncbi:MAG: ABC transporter permease [Chloroflexi bacterium]|nr:ABC transporter permease [Chloroflexota bacterium]
MSQARADSFSATASPTSGIRAQKVRTLWSNSWRQFQRHRLAMVGLVVVTAIFIGTLVGPFVWTKKIGGVNFADASLAPSLDHPFGTNDIGQDLFARVLWGGRISIAVGITSVLASISLGTIVGAIAGYFGGRIDGWLMRLTDLFLSLPQLPFLLMVIYLFREPVRQMLGPELGIFFLIVSVIAVTSWMPVARVVRASFLSLKHKEFVEAAHALGVQTGRIIFRHILPNVLSPVIVAATIGVGGAIITESALSFLGLGFPPDVPSWGRLLYDSLNFLEVAPHMAIFPGMFIFLAVVSINYVGDGLRDALDPRKTG